MARRPAQDKAEALLDAHVAWVTARLEGNALREEIEKLLDALLDDAEKLRLKDVVTPAAIHHTVHKYAVEMQLGGAIPELVGDIARSLYGHRALDKTRLEELLPDKQFEELLDKLLELKTLREAVVREAVGNPIFSSLIADLLYSGIRDYVANSSRVASRVPGAKSALKLGKAVVARTSPALGGVIEDNLKAYVKKNTESSLRASEEFLLEAMASDDVRDVVLDLWADNKHLTVATLRDYVSSLDVEELFVISYERWQHLRKTRFFSDVVNAGIDAVFDKFGSYTLRALLDEIGVSREMMLDDAMRFVPPVVAALKKKKLLEPAVRRNLEGFYASDAARAILQS